MIYTKQTKGTKVRSGLAIIACLLLGACAGTITPKVIHERVASWDGTNQDSGFLGFAPAPDRRGILSAHARDRYNGLIEIYGTKFVPPIVKDDGIVATSTNTFLIDPQHLQYFVEMNRWRKSGL
jgi:hypothetical protein